MTSDPLKRPLTFGDKDQIEAVRELERKTFWDKLEDCDTCEGYGECTRCGHCCEDCGGIGKTPTAYLTWEKAFPGYATWKRIR